MGTSLLLVSITILASTVSVEQFHRKSNEEKDATGKYHLWVFRDVKWPFTPFRPNKRMIWKLLIIYGWMICCFSLRDNYTITSQAVANGMIFHRPQVCEISYHYLTKYQRFVHVNPITTNKLFTWKFPIKSLVLDLSAQTFSIYLLQVSVIPISSLNVNVSLNTIHRFETMEERLFSID